MKLPHHSSGIDAFSDGAFAFAEMRKVIWCQKPGSIFRSLGIPYGQIGLFCAVYSYLSYKKYKPIIT